jgi:hypothetical protein
MVLSGPLRTGPGLGSSLSASLDIKLGAKLKDYPFASYALILKNILLHSRNILPDYVQGYSRGCARLKVIPLTLHPD